MTEGTQEQPLAEQPPERRRVWDAPTRLLKWTTAGVVLAAWLLGSNMSFQNINQHFILGYVAGGLLLARLLWAVVGAPASRFSTMLRDLAALPSYIGRLFRPEPSHWPGHNPLGSLWLLAFWAALGTQVGTGLFAYSDSFFDGGPLNRLVDGETRVWLTGVHELGSDVILLLVGLHLAAVVFYAVWKNENLIGPMIHGWKTVRKR